MNPSPFDSSDADVALRTADGSSFKVHSRILAEASPFFRDLFTLPQPAADKDAPTAVDAPESSEVMHTLLEFIYPVEDPPVETLSHLGNVLEAALKYDLVSATQSLRRLLVSPRFLENEPCRVYAIACRHELDEEAKLASSHTLTVNILDAPPAEELKFITAYDYHRLLKLHRTRGLAARELLVCPPIVRCTQCCLGHINPIPRWWDDWSTRAKKELRRKPTTHIIFSLAFLAQSSQAGCQRCGASILDSHEFISSLRKSIDDLPATI